MKNKQRLQEKREEAKVRQDIYDKLTIKEKLERLDHGNFVAKKQREKLNKELK